MVIQIDSIPSLLSSVTLHKFAAIDIGSNAVRLKVHQVLEQKGVYVKKLIEYIRFPLRLGSDVFDGGYIRPETRVKLGKLLLAYKQLCDLYEVDDYMVCATSALRDSANATEVKAWVEGFTGLDVEVITGQQEATMVGLALTPHIKPDNNYIHVDVGGGSTEINIYLQGERIAGESFQAGHVRNRTTPVSIWPQMDKWIYDNLAQIRTANHEKGASKHFIAIATGGNISKLISLYGQLYKPKDKLTYAELLSVYLDLSELDIDERSFQLNINLDRADVIVPSAEIYLHVLRESGARYIFSPDVGLADGIILFLMQRNGLDPKLMQR